MSIQTYIKDNQPALCALLQSLVRIPTVNPPGDNYAEIVGLLEAKCQELGMQTQVVPVQTDYANEFISNADSHPRLNLIARWMSVPKKRCILTDTLMSSLSQATGGSHPSTANFTMTGSTAAVPMI